MIPNHCAYGVYSPTMAASTQSATLTAGPMPEASEISLGPVECLKLLARWASGLRQ